MSQYSRNKTYTHWFLLLLALMIQGCGQDGDRYFPLGKGNYWRYDMNYQTMDGNFRGIYALEMLPPKKEGDAITYQAQTIDGAFVYYRKNEEGILRTGREKTIDLDTTFIEQERYVFKYPLEVGHEWQDDTMSRVLIKTGPPQKTGFRINTRVPVTVRIESLSDTVEVRAGTFEDCMRISVSGDSFTNAGNYVGKTIVKVKETSWYAPGVGLIKSVREETTTKKALDRGTVTLELAEYRL